MKYLVPAVTVLAAAMNARGEVRTETVEYKLGDVTMIGYVAWDDAIQGQRPGVLVVHEWYGLNDYAKSRARQLAQLGYVAFAVDMYGNGVSAKDAAEAGKLAAALRNDRPLMRARAQAALETLRKNPLCDPRRVAAIGYCFGGGVVLELARSGADIAGVVELPRQPRHAESRRREEHQGEGARPARRGRSARERGAGREFPAGDAQREGGLADDLLRRRGAQLHQPRLRRRSVEGRGLQRSGRPAFLAGDEGRFSTRSSKSERRNR